MSSLIPANGAETVLGYTGEVFGALWVILAIGLGVMLVPKIIGAAKTVFSGRR